MNSFGKNLRRIRTQKNMSQDEFAALLGTSKQVISRYENDQRSPKVSVVADYADKLGVSIAELSGEERSYPSNLRSVFVENLNRYMKMRGVDQSDIVNALDVSASTVSDWATGKKYPRVDSMQRLADFLGVLLSDLTVENTRKTEDDLWTLREEEREDPDRKALFMLSKYGSAKDIRQVNALIDALKATNPDFYDGDDPA